MEDVQDMEAGDQAVKASLAGGRGRLGRPGISGKLDRGQSGKPDGADHLESSEECTHFRQVMQVRQGG